MVKKDICNVVISFQTLEVRLPEQKKKNEVPILLGMVFKRGSQQRYETDKILYEKLGEPNSADRIKNHKMYSNIIKNI